MNVNQVEECVDKVCPLSLEPFTIIDPNNRQSTIWNPELGTPRIVKFKTSNNKFICYSYDSVVTYLHNESEHKSSIENVQDPITKEFYNVSFLRNNFSQEDIPYIGYSLEGQSEINPQNPAVTLEDFNDCDPIDGVQDFTDPLSGHQFLHFIRNADNSELLYWNPQLGTERLVKYHTPDGRTICYAYDSIAEYLIGESIRKESIEQVKDPVTNFYYNIDFINDNFREGDEDDIGFNMEGTSIINVFQNRRDESSEEEDRDSEGGRQQHHQEEEEEEEEIIRPIVRNRTRRRHRRNLTRRRPGRIVPLGGKKFTKRKGKKSKKSKNTKNTKNTKKY
jgi:YD repeat-containing protein